eukprot:COSAG01_NODE_1695_length_9464_cov_4.884677_5_plen_324_part_00
MTRQCTNTYGNLSHLLAKRPSSISLALPPYSLSLSLSLSLTLTLTLSLSLSVMCVGKSGATHQVVLALERCVHPGVQRDVEGACAAESAKTTALGWLSERAPCPSFNNRPARHQTNTKKQNGNGVQRRRSRQAWDLQWTRGLCVAGAWQRRRCRRCEGSARRKIDYRWCAEQRAVAPHRARPSEGWCTPPAAPWTTAPSPPRRRRRVAGWAQVRDDGDDGDDTPRTLQRAGRGVSQQPRATRHSPSTPGLLLRTRSLAHLMRPVGRGRCRVRRIMASYSRSMVWLKVFAEAAARVVPTVAAARAVHPTDDGTRTQPTLLRRRG